MVRQWENAIRNMSENFHIFIFPENCYLQTRKTNYNLENIKIFFTESNLWIAVYTNKSQFDNKEVSIIYL